jgi:peptide/nickel transport system substrate-binding protein
LTKLAEEGLNSAEIEDRAPVYKKMAAELSDEAFLIFITSTPILFGVSEKTANNPTVQYRYGEDSIDLRGLKAND